jgi:transposase
MITAFPAERWLVIEDNLSTHHSRDVKTALLAWPEIQIQFLPKYASWLNLIEPWWKQLKSLALKGRRFENAEELQNAFEEAHRYWMRHRRPYHWRKIPEVLPTAVLGGYGSILIPRAA